MGGPGNDLLLGGAGSDRLEGGPGNDRIDARDNARDFIFCGGGTDTVLKDTRDVAARDCASVVLPPPMPPPTGNKQIILTDEPWRCRGKVDLDLVKVTMRTTVEDAIRLDKDCSGRVGRVEIDTWTADGIKVQNAGTVAHDFVIESGYVKCHDVAGDYHQDGIQVDGRLPADVQEPADRLPRELELLPLARGLAGVDPDGRRLRRLRARPELGADALLRSVAPLWRTQHDDLHRPLPRDPDRARRGAARQHQQQNLPRGHPSCKDVTGRGGSTP